jgi:hypothetical protein
VCVCLSCSRAKYSLQHLVRVNLAGQDRAYRCVYQLEDDNGEHPRAAGGGGGAPPPGGGGGGGGGGPGGSLREDDDREQVDHHTRSRRDVWRLEATGLTSATNNDLSTSIS